MANEMLDVAPDGAATLPPAMAECQILRELFIGAVRMLDPQWIEGPNDARDVGRLEMTPRRVPLDIGVGNLRELQQHLPNHFPANQQYSAADPGHGDEASLQGPFQAGIRM